MTTENSYTPSPKLVKLRTERSQTEAELEKALREQEVIDHQLRQAENRVDYLKKGERNRRTHRLCIKGGVIESLAPGLTDFSEKEFFELMETVFSLPQVDSVLREEYARREKNEERKNG